MKAITPVDEKESGHMTLGAVCVVYNGLAMTKKSLE